MQRSRLMGRLNLLELDESSNLPFDTQLYYVPRRKHISFSAASDIGSTECKMKCSLLRLTHKPKQTKNKKQTYIHTHTHTHSYIHTDTHTHIHTYMHTHTYTHNTHIHIHIHIKTYYIHTYIHNACMHACTHAHKLTNSMQQSRF
jgi:hypothetical protein